MKTNARRILAAHAVVALARAQARGRAVHLDLLARTLGASREDTRAVVGALHAEGHVDALRMRLTMTGLAVAANLRACRLRSLAPERTAPVASVA